MYSKKLRELRSMLMKQKLTLNKKTISKKVTLVPSDKNNTAR